MRILYVAGREAAYSRTRIVAQALRARGHDVVTCLPPDRRFRHYPRLLLQTLARAPGCDVVLVGFYGQLLLPFIRLLTWKPIVFDMYITTYDTMVFDRNKAEPGSLKAKLYGLSDWLSYRMASLSILDSQHVIEHFGRLFRVDTRKLRRLFLAVDDSVIHPREVTREDPGFLVHFHGEYTPFHGVRHILRAAKLLEAENIRFQIVGKGITYDEDMRLARELDLKNVTFHDPVPYDELASFMARADVCLGIFGDNQRASLVMTNKVIEAIGMAKPLVTERNAPVQELLKHRESVYLVERANPQALADALRELAGDPVLRQAIAHRSYEQFQRYCTIEKLGEALDGILGEAVKS
jgi:glycosyltransferase involved in cell wall biosynthesis